MRYRPPTLGYRHSKRNGSEFLDGDDYFHWGMYLKYANFFPNDVNYTIGKSDFRKDWYFEQVPHAVQDNAAGTGMGRATTWTIHFNLPAAPHGKATLRLAICGVGARHITSASTTIPPEWLPASYTTPPSTATESVDTGWKRTWPSTPQVAGGRKQDDPDHSSRWFDLRHYLRLHPSGIAIMRLIPSQHF